MRCSADERRHARLRRRALGRYRYVRLRWRALFAAVDLLGGVLFAAARALRRGLLRSAASSRAAARDPRVILLVQLDHLGDAVITAPMIPLLRRRWPKASIEVLASASNRRLFQAMPDVDRVYVCRTNRFARAQRRPLAWLAALAGWGLYLRRRRIDLAIDVRGEFPLALLCWLTGAPRRLGWNCGGGGFLLTDSPAYVPNRPEIASRFALLARLGIKKGVRTIFPVPVEPAVEPKGTGPFFQPLIVAHVGAGTSAKMWPAAHWATLLARLSRRHPGRLVLVGSRAEQPIAQEIRATVPEALDMTGRLELLQLATLVHEADLFLGADSGPAHLAAALGTPVVALFSGTNDPDQWQPRGSAVVVLRHDTNCAPCHRQRCARPDHPCMRGLEPSVALSAAECLLSLRAKLTTEGAAP